MSLTAGTRIGSFEVLGSLGAGGMGEVYRARDTRLKREVALKILPPPVAADSDRVARFEREAEILAALNHPNIAHIHGVEDAGGSLALVMELVEGEDLAERLARGPLPLNEALPLARQIAEAVEAAHERGIVHRDLKPANIKITPDGRVKVLDFGLARIFDDERDASGPGLSRSPTLLAHSVPGVILGTAAYMSPEQARGKPVDARTDVWAFGCVLYEMLTARQVFAGETVSDIIAAVLGRDPAFEALPGDTPAAIRTLLRRCLARDPRARLHHIADARLELEDLQSGSPEGGTPSPPRHRGRSIAAGVVAGAAATAVAAYVAWRATTPAAAPRQPIHLSVPMPSPISAANGVVVSPDGRHVVAQGPGGVSTLHALDGSPSRPLEGVAGCWSPDSRSLVLQRANGDLVRMDLAGGPPVAFANAPGIGWGCTWSRSGTLLIDQEAKGALREVTVASGRLEEVGLDDGIGGGGRRFRPQFLPDGRRFLYWSLTADGQRSVRAGSLDSRQTTLIVASEAPAIYTAGHLLFQRGATLVAQPFDERTLTLGGEPQAITSEAAPGTFATGLALFDVSETGMLVFSTTNGGVRGQSVWVDRRGNVLGAVPQPDSAELLNPALSPDGTRVAGNRMDPSSGNWDVWAVDLRSGIPTRLTTEPGIDSDAVWSPDGSEIAYVSRRRDAPGIYRLSIADGREQVLLKSSNVRDGVAALRTTDWTRDGRFLVYETGSDTYLSGGDIMALPLASAGAPISVVATPAREKNGRVSPNGRWITFQLVDSGGNSVYVQPFPGPGARTRVSVAAGYHPQWRGDGAELFWETTSPRDPTMSVVYSADLMFSGSSVQASTPKLVLPPHVTLIPLIDNRPHSAVSADGQRFLLRQPVGLPGPAVKVILNWKEQLRVP